MEGVCSLRLPQRSLVDGLVGFECRHLAASRWTPREGPNSCPTLLLLYVCMYVAHLKDLMIVLRCAKAGFGRRTSSSSEASRLWQKRSLVKVVNLSQRCSADSTSSSQSEHLFKLQSAIPQNLLWPYSNKKSTQGFIFLRWTTALTKTKLTQAMETNKQCRVCSTKMRITSITIRCHSCGDISHRKCAKVVCVIRIALVEVSYWNCV